MVGIGGIVHAEFLIAEQQYLAAANGLAQLRAAFDISRGWEHIKLTKVLKIFLIQFQGVVV